jgi:hypothetical protein
MQHLHIYIHVQMTVGRINPGWAGTLAMHGLEEPFFQLCCYGSFLVVAEIALGDTYLPYQLCRCVFFLSQREIDFGCTGRFFDCGGK